MPNQKTAAVLICQNQLSKDTDIFLLYTREPEVLVKVKNVETFEFEIFNDFGNEISEKDWKMITKKMKSVYISHKQGKFI